MAVRTQVQPLDRDIELIIKEDLSPEARSAVLAQYATEEIEEAKQINRRSIGVVPPYRTWVDGREDAPFKSVKPDGVIIALFELLEEALRWIDKQLQTHSPVLTGRYQRSHELFADGIEVNNPNNPPPAEEYIFVNSQPYARKIEGISIGGETIRPPQSKQAPNGVYQVVADLAQRKFGNVASVRFSYRTVIGGMVVGGKAGDRARERNPAIVVRVRG